MENTPSYAQGQEHPNPSPDAPGLLHILQPWPPYPEEKKNAMRRLIILAIEPGKELEVEFEGEFAWWEVHAALMRGLEQSDEEAFEAAIEDAKDEEDRE